MLSFHSDITSIYINFIRLNIVYVCVYRFINYCKVLGGHDK